jgi:hypothetical protein
MDGMCREDEMGNIHGRLQGLNDSMGAVVSGSHCDAIPKSGMYDGTLGVLGSIMAIKTIRDAVRPHATGMLELPRWKGTCKHLQLLWFFGSLK